MTLRQQDRVHLTSFKFLLHGPNAQYDMASLPGFADYYKQQRYDFTIDGELALAIYATPFGHNGPREAVSSCHCKTSSLYTVDQRDYAMP